MVEIIFVGPQTHRVRPGDIVKRCCLQPTGRTRRIWAMPGRNIYKLYVADSYYHIYNHGVGSLIIFQDDTDYIVFLSLLKRYLGKEPSTKKSGVLHPSYRDQVELLAYCLMPNHFHLLVYQNDRDGMKLLLKALSVSYGMYFNKKYKRAGPIFQQRYRASRISNESYLLHISRYLHLNPKDYKNWKWSSLPYYKKSLEADWIRPNRILNLFEFDEYEVFLREYENNKSELEAINQELKQELANKP